MRKKRNAVDNIKTYIIRLLKKNDLYRPELAYQINLLAADEKLRRDLQDAVDNLEDFTITEFTKDNNPRIKMNPLLDALKKQTDQVRKDLAALYMNRERKQESVNQKPIDADENDPLIQLMNALNS